MILFIIISFIPFVNFLVTAYNYFTYPEFSVRKYSGRKVKVSVLIPVRNEERNIRECLRRIQNQTYSDFEIIIMDDFSDDNTYAIAAELAENDSRINVCRGTELPYGWIGKNWVCMQLAERASGDYILFIDADVLLENSAIESALYYMSEYSPDLLTVFPVQITKTAGEKLTVPLFNWILLSFLPLKKVYSGYSKYHVAAIGQFMFWKKDSYTASGGHKSVKDKVVEDIELAKYLKARGFRIYPAISKGIVSCRMYRSFNESLAGFTKNYFPASGRNALSFMLIMSLITFSYILPPVMIYFNRAFLITLTVILIQRMAVSAMSRKNILYAFLFPLQMTIFFYTGIKSVMHTKSGKATWKDRKV